MARIKITDISQGRSFRTGVNGRFYDIPVNVEHDCDEALLEHLEGLGVAFETIEGPSKRASSSKEGSEGGLAPTGAHDVRAPAMDPRSLGDRVAFGGLAGDQPGDLTDSGGVKFSGSGGPSIEDDAAVSDIRVAAERNAPENASVARLAGEGEGGTRAVPAPKAAKKKPAKK